MSTKELAEKNRLLIRMVSESTEALKKALNWSTLPTQPKIGIVLGSGLGLFCAGLKDKREVVFTQIPYLPDSAVPGHSAKWVYGVTAKGVPIIVSQGRIHGYDGHESTIVTLPIRILAKLGLKHVVLTNAAGSVNPDYRPGDFVLIDDHINLQVLSPLRGIFDPELGPRFVDLSEPYDLATNTALEALCRKERPAIRLHRGVYCSVHGPQYETRAEIRMIGKLGGDVVGMSTVPETIVAKQCGLKVTALSCVTNFGCGLSSDALDHTHVAAMAQKRAPEFCWLLEELVAMSLVSD